MHARLPPHPRCAARPHSSERQRRSLVCLYGALNNFARNSLTYPRCLSHLTEKKSPSKMLKEQKDRIRGMLADKQSTKTIAFEMGVSEQEVQALAKPKAVSSRAC